MALIVDSAVGSRELVDPLKELGLPAELGHLESSDIAFEGRGRAGTTVKVGIEYKKIEEVLGALSTGRLPLYQAPRLLEEYHYPWLLIEGSWRLLNGRIALVRKGGLQMVPGKLSAAEAEKRLLSLQLALSEKGERFIRVHRTQTRAETLHWIHTLYHWWTDVALDQHKTHVGIYQAPTLAKLSQFRKTASTLPHVGLVQSKKAQESFLSLGKMFAAAPGVLKGVFGAKAGSDVYDAIWREE